MQGNFAQTSTSTFHTADIIDIENNIMRNFDMPRQLFKSHFQEQLKYENRPLLKELLYNKENNKKRLNTQSDAYQRQLQTSRKLGKQANLYRDIKQNKQHNSTKKNTKRGIDLNSQQALTQATFKPIHLKTQVEIDQQERILKRIFKQKFAEKKTMANQQSKKNLRVVSRIFQARPQTKYQQILSQYYVNKDDIKDNIKSKKTLKTIENIGNKHYKRAITQRSIGNQSQKLEMRKVQEPKAKIEKQNNNKIVTQIKQKKQPVYNSLPKTFKRQEKPLSWMNMNFHERQQKVLDNRKKKEDLGIKQKIDQQTQGCTFKPNLTLRTSKQQKTTRSSSVMSYTQRYIKKRGNYYQK